MKKRLGLIVIVWVIAVILLMIPAVAHDTQEITINEGALYTATREVSLALAYTGLPVPTQMRLRNEGGKWPEWEPYNPMKQWLLSEEDGVKTVYVETRYWAKVGWHTLSGNSSITFDATPPVMSAVRSVEPNANGWNNNADVSVTFQAMDALSGVASITGDATVTTEGADQSVMGQAVDKAGNIASLSVVVCLDRTPPIVSARVNPGADTIVWNNTDVSVSFEAVDQVSGVDSVERNILLTEEGVNQSVTGTAIDKAGNVALVVFTNINIDKALPALTIRVSGTDAKPIGEPLDVFALLDSFDGFTCEDPVFAVGTQFFGEDGSVITDALVTLEILGVLSSPEPGAASYSIAWLTGCCYSPVSQQYYALFPAASLSEGTYELWFMANTGQSVRSRIILEQTPEE
ncbi:hypothetical protein KAX14_01185 [Candidatus Bipolaricaulota bacterium]|nr:hypothetical protein [Candidatus Bipolaricaulota bacterium]